MSRRLTHDDPDRIRPVDFEIAASALCPHCHALVTFPGFDAIFAFVCPECGAGVDVPAPVV